LNTNEVIKIGDYRLRLEDIFDFNEFEVWCYIMKNIKWR
jgi:hypothetical protein